jgi:hypothetical protein
LPELSEQALTRLRDAMSKSEIASQKRHSGLIYFQSMISDLFCVVSPHANTFDQQAVTKSVR